MNASSPPPRVVVLGAGVAGLEAAFLLASRLSGRVDLQVVYEHDEFVLRPNLVYVPFGADRAASRLWVGETLARKAIKGQLGGSMASTPTSGACTWPTDASSPTSTW